MTSPHAEALVGQVIDGRYRVLEHIADGGMASVFVAMDSRLDREVALKIMRPGLAADPTFVERFRSEAKASARLTHPNVVGVFDQGTDGEKVFLAMELVRGKTLREVIHEEAPFTAREALAILDPILEALRAAHTAGLIHRDVKPENVIIRTDGEVKVADFGLARAVNTQTTTNPTGMLLGTVSYLAPEQVEFGAADTRSDVYAAGLLLYEMLTGTKAVTGETSMQIAYAHVHGRIPAPSRVAPGVPVALDKVVATATARDADNRYASAAEFLAALRSARRLVPAADLDRRPRQSRPASGTGSAASTAQSGSGSDAGSDADAAHASSRTNRGLSLVPPVQPGGRDGDTMTLPTTPDGPDRRGGDPTGSESARLRVASGPALEHTRAFERPDRRSDTPTGARTETTKALQVPTQAAKPPTRKRQAAKSLFVRIPLVLALILAAGSGWWVTQGPGSMTVAPTTVNLSVEQALSALDQAGLARVDTSEAFSESVGAGKVIDMDPDAGTELRRRDLVTLVVSKGLERYSVPNLINTRGVDAPATMGEQPLRLEFASEEYSETVAAGTIIRQTPKPNEKVKRDTTVTVVVSKGRQPITVPTVVGKPVKDAESILTAADLKLTTSGEENSDTVPKGSVISQKPDTGTLFRGGVVSVLVSKGPVMVAVPDVVGKSKAQAEKLLKDSGLTPAFTYPLGSSLFDLVRTQSVRAGTSVPKGSTVSVSVV